MPALDKLLETLDKQILGPYENRGQRVGTVVQETILAERIEVERRLAQSKPPQIMDAPSPVQKVVNRSYPSNGPGTCVSPERQEEVLLAEVKNEMKQEQRGYAPIMHMPTQAKNTTDIMSEKTSSAHNPTGDYPRKYRLRIQRLLL